MKNNCLMLLVILIFFVLKFRKDKDLTVILMLILFSDFDLIYSACKSDIFFVAIRYVYQTNSK